MELSLESTIPLNNGLSMPRLGIGVYQVPAGAVTESVIAWAFADGYRHIDTAKLYRNEESVGTAVRDSGLAREAVWVTTKLWPTDVARVQSAFDQSMKRLALEYVDLYLIHFPIPGLISAMWKQMEKIAESGRARSIGVSNFTASQLRRLLSSARIPPSVNQVNASVFGFNASTYKLCQDEGVVFEAYSPLHRGKGLDNAVLLEVAGRCQRSPAQVLLRWALQKNMVVIPKSVNEARVRENAALYDFSITDDDMRLLGTIARSRSA